MQEVILKICTQVVLSEAMIIIIHITVWQKIIAFNYQNNPLEQVIILGKFSIICTEKVFRYNEFWNVYLLLNMYFVPNEQFIKQSSSGQAPPQLIFVWNGQLFICTVFIIKLDYNDSPLYCQKFVHRSNLNKFVTMISV